MSLKKCTGLFLALLLLVSNIGFAFDVHYCGGEIASVKLRTTAEPVVEKKCCGSKEKKNSCCKDKVVHFEKKSDDATIKFFFFQFAFPAVIQDYKPLVFLEIPNFKKKEVLSYYADANAPPLFKLYHQYIFYS
ncbi:HYC_CC_PP family protein [Flavobacterium anhuiense]|uniref:HYC_CC_PP family protein n=1 Tax=Flavobacterium anhuiense TaxID=459526 RepID=UPI003D9514F8